MNDTTNSTSAEAGRHTPGPWKVGDWLPTSTSPECAKFITTDEAEPMALASVYFDLEKGEANAKLIASAPELLAALEVLLQSHQLSQPPPRSYNQHHDAQRIARAAIARATA